MAIDATRDHLHVDLVPMRRRHVRSVLRIEQRVYPRPWSASLFLSELALVGTRTYVVARIGRSLVGYGGVMYVGSEAHVTTIAVDPAWQRRGVATRVLVALARAARARGVEELTLEVRATNRAAQELYRRFGFTPEGVRKGYYADNGEDAIVMWARGVDTPAYGELIDAHLLRVPGTTSIGVDG